MHDNSSSLNTVKVTQASAILLGDTPSPAEIPCIAGRIRDPVLQTLDSQQKAATRVHRVLLPSFGTAQEVRLPRQPVQDRELPGVDPRIKAGCRSGPVRHLVIAGGVPGVERVQHLIAERGRPLVENIPGLSISRRPAKLVNAE